MKHEAAKKGTGARALLIVALLSMLPAADAPGAPRPRRTPRASPRIAPARSDGRTDRISLDLKDADIKDVLRTFAKLRKFNLVIDPEVKGSVTLRLVDVQWEQALEVILRSNGLAAEVHGNIVRIRVIDR